MRKWWRSFRCDSLDWHTDGPHYGFDGLTMTAKCIYCKRHIMLDVLGNWIMTSKEIPNEED